MSELESSPVTGIAAYEAALLTRIAGGDRGAPLRELYRRYEGRLYGLGCRLLGDGSLAEELVQETFVKVWRNASQFDPDRGPVSAFIFTICRRAAVDLWRRPSSRPHAPGSWDPEATEDATERILLELTVRDAMAALSPAHQEVLRLSFDEGLKQAEIASRLGVPLGTVKTRTYHALRALRTALADQGALDG